MITFLKQIVFSICVAAIAASVAGALAPKTGAGRVMKLCVGLFFLSCVIYPFAANRSSLTCELPQYTQSGEYESYASQLETETRDAQAQLFKGSLEKNIRAVLNEFDIKTAGVVIDLKDNSDSQFQVGNITVTLEDADKAFCGDVQSRIKSELGLDARVTVKKEEAS